MGLNSVGTINPHAYNSEDKSNTKNPVQKIEANSCFINYNIQHLQPLLRPTVFIYLEHSLHQEPKKTQT